MEPIERSCQSAASFGSRPLIASLATAVRTSTLCLLVLVVACRADLEWLNDYHCGTGEVSKIASCFIVGNLCGIADPSKLCQVEVPESHWFPAASRVIQMPTAVHQSCE